MDRHSPDSQMSHKEPSRPQALLRRSVTATASVPVVGHASSPASRSTAPKQGKESFRKKNVHSPEQRQHNQACAMELPGTAAFKAVGTPPEEVLNPTGVERSGRPINGKTPGAAPLGASASPANEKSGRDGCAGISVKVIGKKNSESPVFFADQTHPGSHSERSPKYEASSHPTRALTEASPMHLGVNSPSPSSMSSPSFSNGPFPKKVQHRHPGAHPLKTEFDALFKENRTLLEEVDAFKRERIQKKSVFKAGVQKLLAGPSKPPAFHGFAGGTIKVRPRLAAEDTSKGLPGQVLPTGAFEAASPNIEQTFNRLSTTVFIVVAALYLASAVLVVWLVTLQEPESSHQARVCLTSDCRLHALYLSYRVNSSVRRCDDFEAHVCSAWEPPEGYREVVKTAISEVVVRWMHELRHLLQESTAGGTARRKALSLLDSCMADRNATPHDATTLLNFMKQLNLYWPYDPPANVSALGVLVRLAYKWQMTFWMTLRLAEDPVARNRYRLIFCSGDQDQMVFLNMNHKHLLERDAYVQYWKSHYVMLYGENSTSRNPFVTQMYESATLQRNVIQTLLAVVKKSPKSPMSTVVGKLGNYTGRRLNSSSWLRFLREHVNLRSNGPVSEGTEVLVSDPSLLESIGGLFSKYSDADLIRQMSWEFLQLHALTIDKTPLEMAFSGRWYAMPYVSVYCSRYVETVYRPLLASIYVRKHLNADDRRALDLDMAGLVNAVIEKVNGSSLFDAQGKSEAVKKLRAVSTNIWPENKYFDDDTLETTYHLFPHARESSFLVSWIQSHNMLHELNGTGLYEATVSLHNMISFSLADYDYLTNEVRVAISALTNPVYYPHGSRSMFYGGLGYLYTSQVLKAIDETGRMVRANGTVATQSMLSSGKQDEPEKYRHCQEAHHGGSLLSDLGALEIAHNRFLATTAVDRGKVVSRNYTDEQVFFLTVCRILCELPAAQFRSTTCNALLRNSPEFAEAFNCHPGSPMNPKEKCQYLHGSEN
ncbi:neprilysin-like [Dermacentor albipictus]|uniref:neprilysin-like n=1 Tax=Dermacentor albipictus TaxID=60249 RepID=UPI0031FBED80